MVAAIRAEGGKVPGFGHPLHKPVDPRAERILALAEERGVAGAARGAGARGRAGGRRGLGQAAADERLDADRGGAARPRLPAGDPEGDPDPRPHRRRCSRISPRSSERPIGFLMAAQAEEAIAYEPGGGRLMRDPAVETLPWEAQAARRRRGLPRAGRLSLRALALLPRQARRGRASPTPPASAGSTEIAALPFTEKDELRASRTAGAPDRRASRGADGRGRAHLLDQRHHRRAELHPADPRPTSPTGSRSRARSYAASGRRGRASGWSRPTAPGPFVAGAALDAFAALGLCHIPVGPGQHRAADGGGRGCCAPDAVALTPVLCAAPGRAGAAARGIDLAGSSVAPAPRRRRAGRRRAGAARAARGGLGRAGHRGDGHRRHRGLALGRVRGAGRHALLRPRLRPCRADRPGDRRARCRSRTAPRASSSTPTSRQRAAPLLRFRSRDHVRVRAGRCACGRTAPRVRCIGRTDDMLIVRGVNLFPTAVREVVGRLRARRSAASSRSARARRGVKQAPPLPVVVELAEGRAADAGARRARSAAGMRERAGGRDRDRAGALGEPAAQRLQVEARRLVRAPKPEGRSDMRKLQTPGRAPHHAGRRRPADLDRLLGGRARHALRLRAAEPRPGVGEPPLLRPRRRAADHRLHRREPQARRRRRTPTDIGCVHHLAMAVSAATFRQAVERLDERGIEHSGRQGPRLHGLDLLQGPARPPDRARRLPLRAALGLHPRRGAARGAQDPRRAQRLRHRRDPPRRRHRAADRAEPREPVAPTAARRTPTRKPDKPTTGRKP